MATSLEDPQTRTLHRILEREGLNYHSLTEVCNEEIFHDVAQKMESFEQTAVTLGIRPERRQEIRDNHPADARMRKVRLLEVWKRSKGFDATYLALVEAFLKKDDRVTAECIIMLVKQLSLIEETDQNMVPPGSCPQRQNECEQELKDLDQILQDRQITKKALTRRCERDIFLHFSKHVTCDGVAPYLGFTQVDIVAITKDVSTAEKKVLVTLNQWREKSGPNATYYSLANAFFQMENQELADRVIEYHLAHPLTEHHMTFSQVYPERVNPNWDELDENQKEAKMMQLLQEYEKVCDAYSSVVLDTKQLLENCKTKPLHVKVDLLNCVRHCPGISDEQLSELMASDEMDLIFCFIARKTSWINYRLLESILQNDQSKKALQEYETKHLIPYLNKSLFEIPSGAFAINHISGPPTCIQASLKLHDDIVPTGNEAKMLEQRLAALLKVPSLTLAGYKEGTCIEILFHIPKVIYDPTSPNIPIRQYLEWDEVSQSCIITADITTILLSHIESQEESLSTFLHKLLQCRQLKICQLLEKSVEKGFTSNTSLSQKNEPKLSDSKTLDALKELVQEQDKTLQQLADQIQTMMSPSEGDDLETKARRVFIIQLLNMLKQEKEKLECYNSELAMYFDEIEKFIDANNKEKESLNEKIAQEESLLQGQAQEREQHEKEIIEKDTLIDTLKQEKEKIQLQLQKITTLGHRLQEEIESNESKIRKIESQKEQAIQEKRQLELYSTQKSRELQQTLQETLSISDIKDSQIQSLNEAIKEKDFQIQSLNETIKEKDTQIQSLNEAIKEKDFQALILQNTSWEVSYTQVEVTDQELGRGTYYHINTGWYNEQKVAVKQLHELIMSDDKEEMMHHEINMIDKLRHPNIVSFYAAVFDDPSGYPLIVTELMDMSLRHAYENKLLTSLKEKLVIMRDAAAGLNYLHCFPDPIIHRNLSSDNVLLEAKGTGLWKAKIAGFGSAKFVKQAVTPDPGTIVYRAPEASTAQSITEDGSKKVQSTKIDVFSFGVLLCELLEEKYPNTFTFGIMLDKIRTWQPLLHQLICQCTERAPENRPTMKIVTTTIKSGLLQ